MWSDKFNFSFKRVQEAINYFSEEQLHILEHQIAHKIKAKMMGDFKVMDRVFFDYHGQKISGTIIGLNQKTISMIEDGGRKWNVSPHYLIKELQNEK